MAQRRKHLICISAITASLLALSGCAGRRPAAGSQPPPLTPSPTPAGTAAEAKASTSAEPNPESRLKPGSINSGGLSAPIGYTEVGKASWYGPQFHGKRTSDGEVYDMYQFTAAHRTLPFNSMVRVTNLDNGKSAVVRITDRGPFVADRIIDLSLAAAKQIGAVGPGVVPVRIQVLSGGNPTAGFFTVQVGAFQDRENAERLQEQLRTKYSPVFIQEVKLENGTFYRVQVGRVSGEQAAQQLSDELRTREGFTPYVVRLDEVPAEEMNP